MTLYVPTAFGSEDFAAACRLIEEHPFATLVTTVDGEPPSISHLPMLIEEDRLTGHLARANPHWRNFSRGRTTAIFHGPHAYVSPTAYVRPEASVPTWNYATVHVEGTPSLLDEAAAGPLLVRLTAHFEHGAFRPDPQVLVGMLHGIVAFAMPLRPLQAKFKMSQSRSAADRAGVIAYLEASGRPGDRAVAGWMRP